MGPLLGILCNSRTELILWQKKKMRWKLPQKDSKEILPVKKNEGEKGEKQLPLQGSHNGTIAYRMGFTLVNHC